MACSEGRLPALYFPSASSRNIAGLYSLSTFLLLALGREVGAIHHSSVKASFKRIRSTLTHWAGVGSLAGS